MQERVVFLNGDLVPLSTACLSVLDHGFLYGDGVFETLRVANGVPFRFGEHFTRLQEGASVLQLRVPFTPRECEKALKDTVVANGLREAYVRVTISRGPGDMGPDPATCLCPTLLIVARALAAEERTSPAAGRSVVLARFRANEDSPLTSLKTLNYLPAVIARMEARQAGADDALFLNTAGFVTEATSSNVFLVTGGVLITPGEADGLLPGVTRKAVLQAAKNAGMTIEVRHVKLADVRSSEEAFLTNSICGLVPLLKAQGRHIGAGRIGPVTQMLADAYAALMEEECR
jgi:branched-chain amino acid aminotransferase